MTPKFLGALTRWLLKGCKTNFFKEEWIGDKESENLIIGYVVALLLLGLAILLMKSKLW